MSNLNDGDIFGEDIIISFDELRQLDKADISVCVDKYSALSICEKSSALPAEIYNIWVQKLFKAYDDLHEFTTKDWQRIIQHLSGVLQEFVKNINSANDLKHEKLNQWWLDTQELLKWLETVINSMDMLIMCLMLTFVLEVIIKTCKFANKGNIKNLLTIQEMLISLTNKSILKMPITDANEFEAFNKVISSLCDVGCLISSADIKITIETWRAVVKLSENINNCCKYFPAIKIENCTNTEQHWYDKAILGIFKELKQILQLYKGTLNNDNLLKIAQFYLKILRLLIDYSNNKINKFPATKEFLEIYIFCHHEMLKTENTKIDLFIKKGLYDIFLLIHDENDMVECLWQHLKTDVDNFESCDLVLDYLKVNIEYCSKNRNIRPDVEVLLKLYNGLFEGPLIFVDKHKYSKILDCFVVLTAQDLSNKMHKKLCEYVVDISWIRAYTSTEILNIYYSYIFKQQREKSETHLKCYDYWLKMWNKLNNSTKQFGQHKKLIEILLKTILQNISADKLQQYNSDKYENMEIILLLCGLETEQCRQYLQTNLVINLKKLQERRINISNYTELLNLLEICVLKPQLINHNLMECILNTFSALFSLPAKELNKSREFINKSLRIFYLKSDKQHNNKLVTILNEHEQHWCNIQSIFLIEFLLKQRPQSTKILQTLQTSNKLTTNIRNLLETSTSNLTNESIDIKVFKDLNSKSQQSSSLEKDQEQIRKRPRLDEGNFSNIKFILNDLNLNTQKLLQFERSNFDAKDFALIREISKNLDKCLTK